MIHRACEAGNVVTPHTLRTPASHSDPLVFVQAMVELLGVAEQITDCNYELNASVPRSSIVQNALGKSVETYDAESKVMLQTEQDKLAVLMRMRSAAQLLYDKYVMVGAELEVNISGMLRDQFREVQRTYWNINGLELVNVFDPLLLAMRQLMIQSFARYENMM